METRMLTTMTHGGDFEQEGMREMAPPMAWREKKVTTSIRFRLSNLRMHRTHDAGFGF